MTICLDPRATWLLMGLCFWAGVALQARFPGWSESNV